MSQSAPSGQLKAAHIEKRRLEFASLRQSPAKSATESMGRSMGRIGTSFMRSYRERRSSFAAAVSANVEARRVRFESFAESRFHQQVLLGETPKHEIKCAPYISFKPAPLVTKEQEGDSFRWASSASVISTDSDLRLKIHKPYLYRIMAVTTVAFGCVYFTWRLAELVRAHSAGPTCVPNPSVDGEEICLPPAAPPTFSAYLLLFTDVFTWSMWLPGIVSFWTLGYREQADMDVQHSAAPTVDVMIPACGEPNEIVMDTVLAALAIDWNPTKLSVYLLDDGGSDELKSFILTLKSSGKRVDYIRRIKVRISPALISHPTLPLPSPPSTLTSPSPLQDSRSSPPR